jgi:hypothetical protein
MNRLYKNKRGIELTVNFFVIMIISLVILGMGIYLVSLFFTTTEEVKTNLDIQTERHIQRILIGGERVAIPINEKEIRRGKGDIFGLGILNILGETKNFTINIEDGPFITTTNEISNPSVNIIHLPSQTKEILNNEQKIFGIPVRVPRKAQIGTYILNVYVCNCSATTCNQCSSTEEAYDNSVHKIYIKVI